MVSFRSTLVLLALISVASAGRPRKGGTKASMAMKANFETHLKANTATATLVEAAPYLRRKAAKAAKAAKEMSSFKQGDFAAKFAAAKATAAKAAKATKATKKAAAAEEGAAKK